MELEELKNKVLSLEEELRTFKNLIQEHNHDGFDGTNILKKSIRLNPDQILQVGNGSIASPNANDQGESTENYNFSFSVGKDDGRTGFVSKADLMQVDFQHQPNTSTSFFFARRTPLVTPLESTVSTTSGGNTITINGYNFTTDELTGGIINIYNSSGTFIESRTIASNTDTVVTIDGTWGATTSSASFRIARPVYHGSAEYIWQRYYTQEGTGGGIRFGMGVTAGAQNQNGLLYMDATGDLYWRNKSGTSTKLN